MEKSELMNKTERLREDFLRVVREAGLTGAACSGTARRLFDSIAESMGREGSVALQADNAVIEIVDKNSGRLVRHYLELGVEETSNGIRLTGENMAGEEVQIVFLSESAIGKINELQGRGQDEPVCGGHD